MGMSSVIFEILPHNLQQAFQEIPMQRVYELRLRVNAPIMVALAGRSFFLAERGLSHDSAEAITVSKSDIESILHKASEYSVYAVNEQIKQGYLTIRGGVRIGLSGDVVTENGIVSTIKNVQALNIRVPHQIRGCSYQILPYIFGANAPYKTLLISPPGCGKTTMLRDLSWQICDKYHARNVLVLDERGEIAANWQGENQLDVGMFADVISGCNKSYGFENGVRSMNPSVIITDELITKQDLEMVRTACRSGVCVFASVHASGIEELRNKPGFREIIQDQVFDRYVVLMTKDTAGIVAGVYDRNLKVLSL